jgi:NAD(P)-dependent dehydrogenase (short-subunit alcohol dehydrogenase family)
MFDTPGVLEALTAHLLIPRAGTADEIAHAALYLAGSASSYVTGADLRVDGGMTAI